MFEGGGIANEKEATYAIVRSILSWDLLLPVSVTNETIPIVTYLEKEDCYDVRLDYQLAGIPTGYYIDARISSSGKIKYIDVIDNESMKAIFDFTSADVQAALDRKGWTADTEGICLLDEASRLYVGKEIPTDYINEDCGHYHIFEREEVQHEN